MKIAFFTPLSPTPCGISDYSEELLPYLGEYCEIDLFTRDHIEPSNEEIVRRFPCYGYAQFESRRQEGLYDHLVFQISCHPEHIESYDYLVRYGGLMMLHDLNISAIIGAKTLGRGDRLGFFRQILALEGISALVRVIARFLVTRRFPEWTDYPMSSLAIKRSTGIIVHNEYMRNAVSAAVSSNGLRTPVWRVPMGVPLGSWMHSIDPAEAKKKLGLDGYGFVVSSFGTVDERKRISVALRAFSRLLQVVPNAVYVLVGRISSPYVEKIRALGLEDHVQATGRVDMRRFYEYMAASDFCISLRYPAIGETSGALLRVMSMGKAVAITNYAQFREYPDNCCIKIDLGETEEDRLFEQMCCLASDATLRANYGRNALRYIETTHTLDQAARGYYEALKYLSEER
jgi:glycosyltransferase involved in cell wall biosynthesis